MYFRNEPSLLKYASKKHMISIGMMELISYIWVVIFIYITTSDGAYRYTRITISLVITFFLFCLLFLISARAYKREYESYKIEVTDETISIRSRLQSKNIKIKDIKRITRDNNGNIQITLTKPNKVGISRYIERKTEFEEILSRNNEIENIKQTVSLVQYIPVLLFFGLFVIRLIPNYALYLVFAFAFLISTIFSTLNLLFGQYRKSKIILTILINIFILFVVSRNIMVLLSKIMKT